MLSRLRTLFDTFTLLLMAVVAVATLLPAQGAWEVFFVWLTRLAIALLFFMHGAKLSRQAIIAGATHWRLHLLVFACTFVMFPLIGWALKPLLLPLLGLPLYIGMLYLCALPGTVQSAIAFTSIARGNVSAAVCSASASSLIGIGLTPLLLTLLLDAEGVGEAAVSLDAVGRICLQLLLPFVLGHLSRPWTGDWIARNRGWLVGVDQSSILLVVYTAFSASVVGGLWQTVSARELAALTLTCCALLALVLWLTAWLARRLGFSREDEITIVFCGSKKSMATGVPMAQLLFTGGAIGPALLPLMLFHQIQLMVCAVLAQRYARREESAAQPATSGSISPR
ncbi:bile acid:sodium symporter [Halomonas sp. KAO]|uniref:bile acid:sodium symporter family protein n=1 Tax=unclassified Halomonas TaxID=2609666 RepID=UPI0018A11C8B|nr:MULTISPECIES: bile acid:sodium symporter family protein [unclassified Halomonas]MBF7054350.1 bile acid:sodium symporter [Halomonas sp. KAO]MDT0499901.1 bile acid:sodium symporter family protein [Halomonas sp. PAR7]MDT0512306.1 bile acid:sodium symporter family protein [Halomonas sp. LES1]MDT0590939.1 bile acid:sodium symporter family protein [Halomonas sp. PAR8]